MLLKHWQGFFVCRNCWEPRQPQDFVQGTYDVQIPPWTQPPPKDIFVGSANLTTENDLDLLVDPDNGVFTEAITN
jgi:hypothetical protein